MQGLMFLTEMLKQIELGKKCVTRRLLTKQPPEGYGESLMDAITSEVSFYDSTHMKPAWYIKPRLKPGQTVFIQEPYWDYPKNPTERLVIYKALDNGAFLGKWKNKMFMPAKYARLFAVIQSVKPEKLGDITPREIELEGTSWQDIHGGRDHALIQGWIRLWNSIHGKNAWERDKGKWVWRYSFELIQTGILRKVVKA